MSENESNWIESFMFSICVFAGSRVSLNDGFSERLRLVFELEF